jgi:quercetin dioxygenase-like cupin family protein
MFNERTDGMQATQHTLGSADGRRADLPKLGNRYLIDNDGTDGRFSLIEHTIPPHGLAAPTHTHEHEDEYSYVLTGRMGALIGDEVVEAGPGELVFKPRGIPHAFWNGSAASARILDVIVPAGFERFFEELSDMGGVAEVDEEAFARLRERYGLEMRPDTVPELIERFGVRLGERLSGGWVPPR